MAGYNQHVKDGEIGDRACAQCSIAASEYSRNVRRLKAYGQWQPWADPEPVRQHIRNLMDNGMPLRDIAIAADVPLSRVTRVLYGRRDRHIAKTRTEFAEAVLALRPKPARVPSLGAARRLQALVAIGYSTGAIGRRLGVTYSRVGQIIHQRTTEIFRESHEQIAALYEELSMVPPPRVTSRDRQRYRRALAVAQQNGYLPPLAWDDIDNDPTPVLAEPERAPGRPLLRDAQVEDAEWLADAGENLTGACARLGMKADSLRTACKRAGRLDVYRRLADREPDRELRAAVRASKRVA
jgi:hypothetical protein